MDFFFLHFFLPGGADTAPSRVVHSPLPSRPPPEPEGEPVIVVYRSSFFLRGRGPLGSLSSIGGVILGELLWAPEQRAFMCPLPFTSMSCIMLAISSNKSTIFLWVISNHTASYIPQDTNSI
jgi:hypothetical protein